MLNVVRQQKKRKNVWLWKIPEISERFEFCVCARV
jgi:hypothetical protein